MDKPTKPLSHLKLGNIAKGGWWWKDFKNQKIQGDSYKIVSSSISEASLLNIINITVSTSA